MKKCRKCFSHPSHIALHVIFFPLTIILVYLLFWLFLLSIKRELVGKKIKHYVGTFFHLLSFHFFHLVRRSIWHDFEHMPSLCYREMKIDFLESYLDNIFVRMWSSEIFFHGHKIVSSDNEKCLLSNISYKLLSKQFRTITVIE